MVSLNEFHLLVVKYLAHNDFKLPVTNDDGEFPVIVALDSEPFSVLNARVKQAGGYGTIFSLRESKVTTTRIATVIQGASALYAGEPLSVPGDGESTVGMFFDHLESSPDGVALSVIEDGSATIAKNVQPMELENVTC